VPFTAHSEEKESNGGNRKRNTSKNTPYDHGNLRRAVGYRVAWVVW
jgi:hypothetical protein